MWAAEYFVVGKEDNPGLKEYQIFFFNLEQAQGKHCVIFFSGSMYHL